MLASVAVVRRAAVRPVALLADVPGFELDLVGGALWRFGCCVGLPVSHRVIAMTSLRHHCYGIGTIETRLLSS